MSKNTLSDYLAELGVDIANMQEFLNKLSSMLTTTSETVSVQQKLQDGSNKTFIVPSFAYLSNRVTALDNKFNTLLTNNAKRVGVVDETGQVRNFELNDISQVLSDLDSVADKSIVNPTNFKYKNNWFFESFLNPLLYIDADISNIITSDIDKFEINRVIITSKVKDDLTYFDTTYKDVNDINYVKLIKDLNDRHISYFEDIDESSVPAAKNRIMGSFDILNVLSDSESKVLYDEVHTTMVSKYVLNTLRYTEKTPNSLTGTTQRFLKIGDILITSDNSEYSIKAINVKDNSVILQREFGIGDLTIGANRLRIKPKLELIKRAPINVGYNERQVIFLRPYSSRLKVTTQNYSLGFGIYTNDLSIALNTGEIMKLDKFYNKFVSDFSLVFLNYTKDKKIPAILGEVPSAVTLSSDNFRVVQVDSHIQSANDIQEIKQNISSLESVKSQITEVDRQLSEKRAQLNTNQALTESQQLKLNKELKTLVTTRSTLSAAQASKISTITTAIKGTPALIKAPVYHIKGMWSIPEPSETVNGKQYVVQFKIAYRILNKVGTSEAIEQITYDDTKGNKVTAAFSPWKEILSKPRTKVYNEELGFYEWANAEVTNPNVISMNRVEIPINKGEVIEIRIKSLSEAGWPDNPIESEWSNSVTIEFPSNLQTVEDVAVLAQQAFAEEIKIKFSEELAALGLDLHLATSFTNRDKYFPHKAEDIASGFFTTDGRIIDVYAQLKNIGDTLESIQNQLASGVGVLQVSIVDQDGNSKIINSGQTIQLFAGYYKEFIAKSRGGIATYEHGKVITNQYFIKLENTTQSPLQLIASMNGGIGELVNTSNQIGISGYDTNLRYDVCPLSINTSDHGKVGDFKHKDGYQSGQSKGQIIYNRYKSVNLADKLICGDNESLNNIYDPSYNIDYQYDGTLISKTNTTVPYTAGHYLPYNPRRSSLSIKVNNVSYNLAQNPNVWNGTLNGTKPVGNGLLSEFCISTDHPDIRTNGKYNISWTNTLTRPKVGVNGDEQQYLPFSHAIHFETSETEHTNAFGVKHFAQAAYKQPIAKLYAENPEYEYNYPIKLGFLPNDKYLIGKYTCGSYLYISPDSHESIAATAYGPIISKRIIEHGEGNALMIPLTFQYRCSDYLGYVGGYRANLNKGLRNIKYSKRVGFDIELKDDVFSFDVIVSAQYEKETSMVTPIDQITNIGGKIDSLGSSR